MVWIDCEMTGLNLESDRLIEIAALVTDADLNILGDGIDVVIHADDESLDGMVEVVTQMHTRSGLINEVRASAIDVPTAEQMVMDYIRTYETGQDRAAGRELDRHRPRIHRPRHARARQLPPLPHDRRQLHQGAVPPLVPADLLRPAR